MKQLKEINITIFVLDPAMEMLSMETIEEWREKDDYWKDWDERKLTEHNQDCLRRRDEGFVQLQARTEVLEDVLDLAKLGFGRAPRGARVDWRTPWFKPADMDGAVNELVDKVTQALACLHDGGYRKLCEEEPK